jgi:4,5-dihydroxyphthalate decarboxylase
MAKHRITMGLPYHPRTRALIDGEIGIDGYELDITHEPSAGERHYRFAQGEWDVGEYSAATFLRTREKGFRYIALPIFFERGPRQRNIYFCEGKLNHPSELKGKKIGCFRYGATAVVWARGFLLDEYGLKTTDMNWYVSGREVYIGNDLPVKVERLDPSPPFGQKNRAKIGQQVAARCSCGRRLRLSGTFGGRFAKPWVVAVKPLLVTLKSSAGFEGGNCRSFILSL